MLLVVVVGLLVAGTAVVVSSLGCVLGDLLPMAAVAASVAPSSLSVEKELLEVVAVAGFAA